MHPAIPLPIPVAVLGATGSVGQRFLQLLDGHPWFRVAALTASDRSSGRRYRDAVSWLQSTPLPAAYADLELRPTAVESLAGCRLAFSALGSDVARATETALAEAGLLVVSNASAHRMDDDVPLLVPEINPEHLGLLRRTAAGGGILTNPNCSTIGLVLALGPLDRAFGVERAHVVTLQAVSGAGIPGVPGMQAIDNVIPWIAGEEEKIETETRKILARLDGERIVPHPIVVSAAVNRVPVVDGHTLCVSVALRGEPSLDEVVRVWEEFQGPPQRLELPSAPSRPVIVLPGDDVPQPRLHRDLGRGMAATVGRLRQCPLLGYKFVTLSHNTIRGAAGGALLVAELAVAEGVL